MTFAPSWNTRPFRIDCGLRYDAVPYSITLLEVITAYTGETFRALNRSNFGETVTRPILIALLMLKSSWLMRSPNSVFGAISGTLSDESCRPGSTRWPAVHLP